MSDSEDETIIVIDNGSGIIKSGFAGNERPDSCEPSRAAAQFKPKYLSYGAMNYNGQCYDPSQKLIKSHKSERPIERGIITDWKHMELVWQETFDALGNLSAPVLITEAPLTPKENREKMIELMFETFTVPKFYVACDGLLALFSSGRTTGTAVTSGYEVTNITPIYEGYILPHAVQKLDIAGKDMTAYLGKILQDELKSKDFELTKLDISKEKFLDNIKEKMCSVASDYDKEMKDEDELKKDYNYELPDGNVISIKMGWERIAVGELLFHPSKMGLENDGIDRLLVTAIMKCDEDIRKELFNNIVLSGGSAMLNGIVDRVENGIINNVKQGTEVKIIAPFGDERMLSVWIGGSIWSSMSTFEEMWVTDDDYKVCGPSIVHRKCT